MKYFSKLVFLFPAFIPLYLVRFEVFSMPSNVAEVIVCLLFVAFILLTIFSRVFRLNFVGMKLKMMRFFPPVSLLLFGVILGTYIATNFGDKFLALGILKSWILIPAFYGFILLVLAKTYEDKKLLIRSYVFSAGILSLWALYQVVSGDYITIDARASGPFESANYLALYVAPALVYSAVSVWQSVRNKINWKCCPYEFVMVVVLGLAILFSKSYGAMLAIFGVGVMFASYEVFYSHKTALYGKLWVKIVVPVVVLVLGGLVVLSQVSTAKFQDFLAFERQSSTSVRVQVWEVAVDLIGKNPVAGIGTGRYQLEYEANATKILGVEPYEESQLHAHSLLFSTHLNSGILGVSAFLYMFILAFFAFMKGSYSTREKDFAAVLLMMFFVICLHGLIDQPFWKNDLALLWWIVFVPLISGGQPVIRGIVEKGDGLGRKVSYPTLNLVLDKDKMLEGVYVCSVIVGGKQYFGSGFVGTKSVLPRSAFTLEVHLLGKCGDLYGKEAEVMLLSKIRGVQKVKDLKKLKLLIDKDVKATKKYLKKWNYA